MSDTEREIMEIIAALERERERQGLSYPEVAERGGIADAKSVRYMKLRLPTLQTLYRVIKGLDLDICLVNGEGVNIL